MLLQLALDNLTLSQCLTLLPDMAPAVDIIEIGTPLIIREGIDAIRQIQEICPEHQILADIKIMDAGKLASSLAFDAGADIVTVLGVAADSTIQAVIGEAHSRDKKVMVDMIGVENLPERLIELEEMGVDFLCIHTAVDQQVLGKGPLEDFQQARKIVHKTQLAVAGGIRLQNIQDISVHQPDIIVVGSSILTADVPMWMAQLIKEAILQKV